MGYLLKGGTWWSLWILSNTKYSVILTFNLCLTEQLRQSYNSSFFSHFSFTKQSGLKTSRWPTKMLILEVLVNGWAGKTPNTGKVYSSKHQVLLQDMAMLWNKFAYLLLQNLPSFTLKASCLFRLVLLTNTSQQIIYYSKASASLLTKLYTVSTPVITPTIC